MTTMRTWLTAGLLTALAIGTSSCAVTDSAPAGSASPSNLTASVVGCVADPDAVIAAPVPPATPLPADLAARLQAATAAAFTEQTAPGIVAAVQTPDGMWTTALGEADPVAGVAMSTDVHHKIGSVTKTFIGTIILQLISEGELTRETPVSDFVAGVTNGDEITIEMLLNMTSGIASYTLDETFQNTMFTDTDKLWTPAETIAIGLALPPQFAPGAEFDYSNTNFQLLGRVIEEVTGGTVDAALAKRISAPLGLSYTSMAPSIGAELPAPASRGYTMQGTEPDALDPIDATEWNPSWAWTAGQMVSTVPELLTYGRALGTGQGVLPAEVQRERLTSMAAGGGYGEAAGCIDGWFGHTGELPGFNTSLYYDTSADTTVAVIATSDIPSGNCTESATTMFDGDMTCMDPATRVFVALSAELGHAFAPNPKS